MDIRRAYPTDLRLASWSDENQCCSTAWSTISRSDSMFNTGSCAVIFSTWTNSPPIPGTTITSIKKGYSEAATAPACIIEIARVRKVGSWKSARYEWFASRFASMTAEASGSEGSGIPIKSLTSIFTASLAGSLSTSWLSGIASDRRKIARWSQKR
ncbi:hypothetical protein BP00DRAFT_122310 [Aspergillus indologenus CBS 114.80]|uniref:Uncharacterized protein n=1 Tax=Aspergillus indologenus CBS 114.80 TaxID=1450541 RepID=A0A2V5IX53_9EURO|nr:hypothetical protein BP00DRAFT_122310 [Aspergillus indologenus CBS 114.80]